MEQPTEPSEEDCCNSGCNPCVFDVYEKQRRLYEAYLEKGELMNTNTIEDNGISQLQYTSFKVIANLELCPNHNLLAFKRTKYESTKRVLWNAGDHFLIKYNSADKACTRAYTPVKYRGKDIDTDFETIVKKCELGLVSNYLCNLKLGEETLWRGPYGTYKLLPNKYDRMVMIAQGTGIAPIYSIIRNILSNEDALTKIILYSCCVSQETILFRDELYSWKSYWNFLYTIFLSSGMECIMKYQEPIKCRKLAFEDIITLKPFCKRDQFLLCGSSSFINEFKTYLCTENVSVDNIVLF